LENCFEIFKGQKEISQGEKVKSPSSFQGAKSKNFEINIKKMITDQK